MLWPWVKYGHAWMALRCLERSIVVWPSFFRCIQSDHVVSGVAEGVGVHEVPTVSFDTHDGSDSETILETAKF